jgi:hypothetical protein
MLFAFFIFVTYALANHGPTIDIFLRQFARLLPIFYIGIFIAENPKRVKRVVFAMVMGAFIVAITDLPYLTKGINLGIADRNQLCYLARSEIILYSDGSWGLGTFMLLYKYVACLFVLIVSVGLWSWVRGKIKKRVLIIIQIAILLMLIISTYTSVLLQIFIATFLFFVFYMKEKGGQRVKHFFVGFILATTVSIIGIGSWGTIKYYAVGTVYEKMIFRTDSLIKLLTGLTYDLSTISGGRDYLTAVSWNTFKEYPLFGAGAFAWQRDIRGIIGMHNSWVDMLGQFGVIGALPIFLMLGMWLKDTISIKKNTWQAKWRTPLIVMWVTYFVGCFGGPLLFSSLIDIYVFCFAGISVGMYRNLLLEKKNFCRS